jgi:diguanylate cyclase (GGDEF)-like protein
VSNKQNEQPLPADARPDTEGDANQAATGIPLAAQLREANENLVLATVRAQVMSELAEKARLEMSHMAAHDYLTGLPNRSLLNDRLHQAINFAQRNHRRVALLFLDLDHFKHINDSLGHSIGDQLLQAVAKRLQAFVRNSDTVSRQGGDEFVLLLAEVEHTEDAALFAEKLIHTLTDPYNINGHLLHITMSIGISIFPDDAANAETALRNADTAMYHAKESGRNNYQVFTQQMNDRAVERQSLEANLHRALEQQEFILYYQPKVDLESDQITGAEALIRWNHPMRGLILPEQFITIAEDCGLIVPIGQWVLREACTQAKAWLDSGLKLTQISVNISALEFRHKGFLPNLRNILAETGLAPNLLQLELTESVLMRDAEPSTIVLEALKGMGLKIAIDDFGTGYSSLSYLRRFPIDTLKIDQSFVQDISDESSEAVIVSAVIAMGKSLRQRLVAEGVETPEQLAFLQSYGCGEAQGFFFSRPVSAADFTRLLEAEQRPQGNEPPSDGQLLS